MADIRVLFLLFIIYSIFGWAIEVINMYFLTKKWNDRGFLIGPYCPIYGFGSIFITLFITSTNDLLSTFLKAVLICSLLEYLTSYVMEVIFKTRWWDYSEKKFNINGRICLETMTLFGLGGVAIVEFASPNLLTILNMLPNTILNILSIGIFLIFLIDIIISYNVIINFKKIPKNLRQDSTDDVTKYVRDTLKNKSYLYKRMINSFPDFVSVAKKYDKKENKLKCLIDKNKD